MTKYTLATILTALAALILAVIIGFVLKGNDPLTKIVSVTQIIEGGAAVALLLIAADIRETVKARHLEGIRYVKSLIGTEEASESRKWVYEELTKASWPLADKTEKEALAICRDFDHIGYLCRNDLIPVRLVVETYNRNIIDMWNRLERFIIQWRQQRRDEDYFWEFEWLANKAEESKRQLTKKR